MPKEASPLTATQISEAMRQIGRKGGKSKSKAKVAAVRLNGLKGGVKAKKKKKK